MREVKVEATPSKVEIVKPDRARSVNIMMAKFKMSIEEIVKGIYQCSPAFTLDQLEAIKGNLPKEEDIEALSAFEGDPSTLGTCEQYYQKLATVKGYDLHVELMLLMYNCGERIEFLERPVKLVYSALKQVKTSKKLRAVLGAILAIGNFVNGGSPRGGAYGYKSGILGKINDIRSTPQYTMLNFLVDQFADRWPELLDLPSELSDVAEASVIDFGIVNGQFRDFDALMKRIKSHVGEAEEEMLAGNMYVPKYQELMEKYESRFETLRTNVSEIQPFFKTILELYGEDSPVTIPDFLSSFGNFVAGFKRVKEQIIAQKAEKEKEAKRQARLQSAQEEKKPVAGPVEAPAQPVGLGDSDRHSKGLLDKAVNNLQTIQAPGMRKHLSTLQVAKMGSKLRRKNRQTKKQSLEPAARQQIEGAGSRESADEFKTLG